MSEGQSTYFDQAAATWDDNPVRVALMQAVTGGIVREVQPTPKMDMLDYGCGTGLVSVFLAPHVGTVTAADSCEGMLTVLRQKIDGMGLQTIRAVRLDLERDPVPDDRYDLIVTNMVMHHVADTEEMLRKFHRLLRSGGVLCVSDLDTEPGVFHAPEAAATVHHHWPSLLLRGWPCNSSGRTPTCEIEWSGSSAPNDFSSGPLSPWTTRRPLMQTAG